MINKMWGDGVFIKSLALFYFLVKKVETMETNKENTLEKKKRKVVSRPVLVCSVKPGAAVSAAYSKSPKGDAFWKAA